MKKQTFSSLGIDIQFPVPESVEEFNLNAKAKQGENPCLNEAILNVIYRGSLADYRRAMLDVVEKITGFKRETEPVLDSEGKPKTTTEKVTEIVDGVKTEREVQEPVLKYKDTENKYFNKLCANLKVEESHFQPLAQLVVDGVKVSEDDGKGGRVLKLTNEGRTSLEEIITSLNGDTDCLDEVAGMIGLGVTFDASASPRQPAEPKKTSKVYLEAADNLISQGVGAQVAARLTEILGLQSKPVTADRESLAKAIQLNEARKRAEAQKQIAASYAGLVS